MIDVLYFDGHCARAHAARLRIVGHELLIEREGPTGSALQAHRHPVAALRWPEPLPQGQRQLPLPDGSMVVGVDAAVWDRWIRSVNLPIGWMAHGMSHWRYATLAVALIALMALSLGRWGLPWVVEEAVQRVPDRLEAEWGATGLAELDRRWLRPSLVPEAQQQQIRSAFDDLTARAAQTRDERLSWRPVRPAYRIEFRSAPARFGPNAFALPGGTLVLTDAFIELMADHPEAILGVLAHELGHVHHRHGVRSLLQAALLSMAYAIWIGDQAGVLATVPTYLTTAAYSREAEREADAYALALLQAGGLGGEGLAVFFERLSCLDAHNRPRPAVECHAKARAERPSLLSIGISSHPASSERIRFFRAPGAQSARP